MDLLEENADRSEDNNLFDDLEKTSTRHESGCSPEPGNPAEPASGPRDQWYVEVVPGRVSDAANRMSRAIEILLDAAAHPRD